MSGSEGTTRYLLFSSPLHHPRGHLAAPLQEGVGRGAQQVREHREQLRHHLGAVLRVDVRHGLLAAARALVRARRHVRHGAALHTRVRHREYPGLADQGGVVVDRAGPD